MKSPSSKKSVDAFPELIQQFARFSHALAERINSFKVVEEAVIKAVQEAPHSKEAAFKVEHLKKQGYFELRDQAISLIQALGKDLGALEKQIHQLGKVPAALVKPVVKLKTEAAAKKTVAKTTKPASALPRRKIGSSPKRFI